MADVHNSVARSRNMAAVKAENTAPELAIQELLVAKGFVFDTHDRKLPGRPDIVLEEYRAIVQVHGCFWHKHDCHLFKWPATRPEFWRSKIGRTEVRDSEVLYQLKRDDWRVLIVWECAIKYCTADELRLVADQIATWIVGPSEYGEIPSPIDIYLD